MLFWSPTLANLGQALILATHVAAAPWPSTSKHATHSVRELRSGIKLESYHPTSEFKVSRISHVRMYDLTEPCYSQTFGVKGLDHPLRKRADATTEEKVKAFLADRFSLNPDTVKFRSGYKSDKVELAYLKQTHKDISFANAVGNVVFGSNGQVVSYSSSFVKPSELSRHLRQYWI
jgi:extracellular elastinolytic metalloproteinase